MNSLKKHKDDILLPSLIPHEIDGSLIKQRAIDGYVNATGLCKASNKKLNDYLRLKATIDFLNVLSTVTGIPVTELIQKIQGGISQLQGTWVHPQVAINLAQWASPKFAVFVSKWIFEWMNGDLEKSYKFPYHIRRYMINRHKIPTTHFSMLDQMTYKLLGALETKGYIIPIKLMPDIALGRMFSKFLRGIGKNPDSFPTYTHVFDDGKRPPVQARLYPNALMTSCNNKIESWLIEGKALKYFKEKDKKSIKYVEQVLKDIKNRELEDKGQYN